MFGRHRPWGLPTLPARAAITPACALAYYPGGAMVGGRASRLAPYRHYTREWHPAPSPAPVCVSPRAACRAPHSCPVAVGRDVPIAPPRHVARGGSPPRCVALHPAPPGATRALPGRRDGRQPGLPARHRPRRLATPTARCGPPPHRYMTPFSVFATLPP